MPGPGVQVLHTSPQTLPSQGLVGSGSGSPSQTGMDIEQRPSALQYSITAGQMVPVQVLQVSPQALPSQGLVGSGASSQAGACMVHLPSWSQNFMTAGQAMPGGQGVLQASPQTLPSQGLVVSGSGSGASSQAGACMVHLPSWSQNFMTAGQAMPGGQ